MHCIECNIKISFSCTFCYTNLCLPCFYETYVVENYPPCKIVRKCAFCDLVFPNRRISEIFIKTIDWHSSDNPLIGGEI